MVVAVVPVDGGRLAVPQLHSTVQFSEGLRLDTLQPSDLVFSDPNVVVTGVEVLDGRTARFTLNVPNLEGVYDYTLAANAFFDLQGTGNIEYVGDFLIDRTGPRIVATSPATQASAPFNSLTFFFNENIDPASVDLTDVRSFIGPSGTGLSVTGVSVEANAVTFTFANQFVAGLYVMTIGPDIRDVANNLMDQDDDGTSGELQDTYAAQLTLQSPDLHVARIDPLVSAQFGQTVTISYTVETRPRSGAGAMVGSDLSLDGHHAGR